MRQRCVRVRDRSAKEKVRSSNLKQLELRTNGALDRIRTYDLPLRRRTLYPLSYEGAATVVAKGNEKELSR